MHCCVPSVRGRAWAAISKKMRLAQVAMHWGSMHRDVRIMSTILRCYASSVRKCEWAAVSGKVRLAHVAHAHAHGGQCIAMVTSTTLHAV